MRDFDYIELKVPAKAQYISVVRLAVSGMATVMGFKFDEIEDIKIATEEAIKKSIQYVVSDSAEAELMIGCGIYEEKFEIMVASEHYGASFEEMKSTVETYRREEADVDLLQEDALGLYLMETLMDEVKIKIEGGVAVFMTKYVTREQVGNRVERITS